MSIYNRWGYEVIELDKEQGFWDGKTKEGQKCSERNYYYVFEAKDKEGIEYVKKGFIELVR